MASLLAVDGTALAYRQLYGMPTLSREDGLEIGGTIGFTYKLQRLVKRFRCTHAVIAFDSSRDTFRRLIDPSYKSNRTTEQSDSDLLQIEMMKQLAGYLGFRVVLDSLYEADDLVASYASQFAKKLGTAVVVAPDKDFLQLLSDKISIFAASKIDDPVITKQDVFEKWGIHPKKAACYQSLVGDSIDAIKSIYGMGQVNASKLLSSHDSVYQILLGADKLERAVHRTSFWKYHDKVLLARKLTKLQTNIPIANFDCLIKPDGRKLVSMLKALHAHSAGTKFAKDFHVDFARTPMDAKWILSTDAAKDVVSAKPSRSIFSIAPKSKTTPMQTRQK